MDILVKKFLEKFTKIWENSANRAFGDSPTKKTPGLLEKKLRRARLETFETAGLVKTLVNHLFSSADEMVVDRHTRRIDFYALRQSDNNSMGGYSCSVFRRHRIAFVHTLVGTDQDNPCGGYSVIGICR